MNGRLYTVQTGVPTAQIIATLSLFRRYLLMLAPLVAVRRRNRRVLAEPQSLVSGRCNHSTLREASAAAILGDRLEKLTTGDELQRLSDTLNEMLARIESAFLRVTQFTADASHELRTPNLSDSHRSGNRPPEVEGRRGISRSFAPHSAGGGKNLVSGGRTVVARPCRFRSRELASDACSTCARRSWKPRTNGVHWWRPGICSSRKQLADCELPVLADRSAVQRLLAILLDNAVKYTPPPGAIELRLEARNGKAVISVRDSGIGISEQDQAKIFERFYRVDKARSRELGGAGIGLAIAEWIVQQHRGSLTVQSSIGTGSTFSIKLPLQSKLPALDTPPESLSPAART